MLSILVPVYNFDVTGLVSDLHQQATSCNIDFEILCYDDCSDNHCHEINRAVEDLQHVVYLELPVNLGRSKIRNRLADDAQYKYLIFMDCDSETISDNYIQNYLNATEANIVVYGGRCYKDSPPADPKKFLRWYYGEQRESTHAVDRNKSPYKSFMTNNMLIPKDVYQSIKMNETIKGYGHEDTAFGKALKENRIPLKHIENPLCHVGLEDAEEFLQKTEHGVRNLAFLIKNALVDDDVKLYRFYKRMKRWGALHLIKKKFDRKRESIKTHLLSDKPNLRQLDFYKLGCLIGEMEDVSIT